MQLHFWLVPFTPYHCLSFNFIITIILIMIMIIIHIVVFADFISLISVVNALCHFSRKWPWTWIIKWKIIKKNSIKKKMKIRKTVATITRRRKAGANDGERVNYDATETSWQKLRLYGLLSQFVNILFPIDCISNERYIMPAPVSTATINAARARGRGSGGRERPTIMLDQHHRPSIRPLLSIEKWW